MNGRYIGIGRKKTYRSISMDNSFSDRNTKKWRIEGKTIKNIFTNHGAHSILWSRPAYLQVSDKILCGLLQKIDCMSVYLLRCMHQACSHGGAFGGNAPQIFFLLPQILCPENIMLKIYHKNKDLVP